MAVFTGNGTNSSPSFTFSSDTDSGLYLAAAGQVRHTVGGQVGLTVYDNSGEARVGVGYNATSPSYILDVHANEIRFGPEESPASVAGGYMTAFFGRNNPASIKALSQDWYSNNYALEIATPASSTANKTFIKFGTEGNTVASFDDDGSLHISSGATGLAATADLHVTSASQSNIVMRLNNVRYQTWTAGIFGGTSTTFRVSLTDYELAYVKFSANRTNFGSSFVVWEGWVANQNSAAYDEVAHSKTSGGTISYTYTKTSGSTCTFDWVVGHVGSYATGVLQVESLVGEAALSVTSV